VRSLRESISTDRIKDKWPNGVLLHGTSHKFDTFRRGGHEAIYFSDPNRRPSQKTQAEAIAEGPFGGWLVSVRLKKGKIFNPYDDPVAEEIRSKYATSPMTDKGDKRIHYVDAPDIIRAASKLGYNVFEFFEPSVIGVSTAVTDPSLIKVLKWYKIERK